MENKNCQMISILLAMTFVFIRIEFLRPHYRVQVRGYNLSVAKASTPFVICCKGKAQFLKSK